MSLCVCVLWLAGVNLIGYMRVSVSARLPCVGTGVVLVGDTIVRVIVAVERVGGVVELIGGTVIRVVGVCMYVCVSVIEKVGKWDRHTRRIF